MMVKRRWLLSFLATAFFILIYTISTEASYRWPRDGRKGADERDGFDYFVDRAGSSASERLPDSNTDFAEDPVSGAGIGKDPDTGRWVARPRPGVCAKLALHPQGDEVDPELAAHILGLAAKASGGAISVRVVLVASDANGNPDMGNVVEELLERGIYEDGEDVLLHTILFEDLIPNCHWIVVEVDDPSDPCDSSIVDDPTKPGGDGQQTPFPPEDVWPPWEPVAGLVTADDDPAILTYTGTLLCPIATRISVVPAEDEFIEIFNPNDFPVPLEEFYVANTNTYFYLPEKVRDANTTRAKGGTDDLFNARFPDETFIRPFEYQTIALSGSANFQSKHNACPTYELYDDGDSACPDTQVLREAYGGSINEQGSFADSAGHLALYNWDSEDIAEGAIIPDTVTDCDLINWGTDSSVRTDKSGISLDGPDDNSLETTYASETDVASQDTIASAPHADGSSFTRSDFSEGVEDQNEDLSPLFNGWLFQDETSENLSATWAVEVLPDALSEDSDGGSDDSEESDSSGGCSLIRY